ncbi:MAG: M23 family metallopeptidase [Bacteroidota bacterium]
MKIYIKDLNDMRSTFLLVIAILGFQNLISQSGSSKPDFISPIDFHIYLSGNFAELRSSHFHSGIDIKTLGVIGKPIRAIADGYVSRIKIQTNGYGKSVYINHPEGYTSVYGHLSEYENSISEYVKKYQYKNKIHTLDIYPAKNELPVKQGEIIALSGNTGSSSGPHIHFEIRNAANQHPLNVQKFGFDITDNVDPRIYNFYLYSFEGKDKRRKIKSRKKIGLTLNGNRYSLKSGDTLMINSPAGFGMEVFDFLNGANNRCGIYYIKMFLNGELAYHFQNDEFSFAETRYINAHTDYFLKESVNEHVQLLFKKPHNKLSMYKYLKDDGVIELLPGENRDVEIVFADISGNTRTVKFTLKNTEALNSIATPENNTVEEFLWDQPNDFGNHLLKISLPSLSLYEDASFNYIRLPAINSIHPWIHAVGDASVPMHKYATLMIKAEGVPGSLMSKACIVSYDEKGETSFEGGEPQKDGWLLTKTREFGNYGISLDTISPQIIPVNFRRNSDMSGNRNLRFVIRDDLSGIQSYKGFIDNKWVLFEYDPKNDLLFHNFDPEIIERGKKHELEIYVEDNRGNKAMFHSSFIW